MLDLGIKEHEAHGSTPPSKGLGRACAMALGAEVPSSSPPTAAEIRRETARRSAAGEHGGTPAGARRLLETGSPRSTNASSPPAQQFLREWAIEDWQKAVNARHV